jgi:8-oxo-dGTP pyrophosphatase MutT (NUDIX family)
MTPAPGAGSESTKKRRRRKRSANRAHQSQDLKTATPPSRKPVKKNDRAMSAKRVDEVSAGGLVIDFSGTQGLLIGRIDQKDTARTHLLWSLPKGHIEMGETPEEAALREVMEETGIQSQISRSLGVIDFWFMAGGKRIHKTVHHYLFREVGGVLAPQVTEVDEVAWFPLHEIIERLAYPDEKKLLARTGDLRL